MVSFCTEKRDHLNVRRGREGDPQTPCIQASASSLKECGIGPTQKNVAYNFLETADIEGFQEAVGSAAKKSKHEPWSTQEHKPSDTESLQAFHTRRLMWLCLKIVMNLDILTTRAPTKALPKLKAHKLQS